MEAADGLGFRTIRNHPVILNGIETGKYDGGQEFFPAMVIKKPDIQ